MNPKFRWTQNSLIIALEFCRCKNRFNSDAGHPMIIIIQAIHLQQYACLSVETFRRHIKCLQDKLKIFNDMVYFLDQRSHQASSNGLLSICPPVYIRQHPWRITIVRCPNPSVKSCHKLSGSVVQIQPWLLCQFNRELCLASYAQSSVPGELNQVNLDLFNIYIFGIPKLWTITYGD